MSKSLNHYLLCDGKVFALGGSEVSWWLGNAERRAKWRRWSFNLHMRDIAATGTWQNISAFDRKSMEMVAEALKAAVAASEGMHALNLHVERTTRYDDPGRPWEGYDEFVLSYRTARGHDGIRLGMDPAKEAAYHDAADALIRRWRLHAGADRPGGPFVLSFTEVHRYEPASPRTRRITMEPISGGSFAVFAPQQWTVMKVSLLGLADAMLESAGME